MKIEEPGDDARVLKTETSPKNLKASAKTPKISKFAKQQSPRRNAIPSSKGLPQTVAPLQVFEESPNKISNEMMLRH